MVSVFLPVKDMTAEAFRRLTQVTYLAVVHGIIAAFCGMAPRNHCRIVQMDSALVYRGIPTHSHIALRSIRAKGSGSRSTIESPARRPM